MHHRSMISMTNFISTHGLPLQISKLVRPFLPFKSTSSISNKRLSSETPPKTHNFLLQSISLSYSTPQLNKFQSVRLYSAESDKEVDKINLKFAEAREEIESAMDSKETVYFDEEAECARAAVKEVLDLYKGLLGRLAEDEKGTVERSMGLKIEQLKAELAQLNE